MELLQSDVRKIEKETGHHWDPILWSGLNVFLTRSREGRNALTLLTSEALAHIMNQANENEKW